MFFVWFEAGFAGDHSLADQRFLYRGYQWDDTLKMYHVRHRVYDPSRMLWIQRDPLGRIPMANKAVGLSETPSGYVWHHVENGKTMEMIPRILHNSGRHTGGSAVIRNGG